MLCSQPGIPADRRFIRRHQRIAALCLLVYLACAYFIMDRPVTPTRIVLAGLSGAILFTMLVNAGLLLLHKFDEFQRALLTRSFLCATVITMGISLIWGFIETFSRGMVPTLPILSVPVILICLTAAAKLLIFRRHRSPVE